jgi:hypothetical protein
MSSNKLLKRDSYILECNFIFLKLSINVLDRTETKRSVNEFTGI